MGDCQAGSPCSRQLQCGLTLISYGGAADRIGGAGVGLERSLGVAHGVGGPASPSAAPTSG
jgi:hypothetical protein